MLRKETKTRTQSPEHIPNPVSVCAIAPHLPKKENERHIYVQLPASLYVG